MAIGSDSLKKTIKQSSLATFGKTKWKKHQKTAKMTKFEGYLGY